MYLNTAQLCVMPQNAKCVVRSLCECVAPKLVCSPSLWKQNLTLKIC